MRTVAEFERASVGLIRPVRASLIAMGAGYVLFLGAVVYGGLTEPLTEEELALFPLLACGGQLVFWLGLLLTVVLVRRTLRRVAADARLRCPHCDTSLLPARRRTVATGRCRGCGRPVFEGAVPARPLELGQFEAAVQVGRQQRLWWVLLGASWLATCSAGLWLMSDAIFADAPAPMSDAVAGMLLIFGWYAAGLPIVWRLHSDPRLACPHCGSRLDPGYVRRTSRCGNCRQPVLADGPTGLAGSSPPG